MLGVNAVENTRTSRQGVVLVAVAALIATTLAMVGLVGSPAARAQGPSYSGPQTQATGPAYFGPAPNPIAYCDSPTYFDPFPENVTPIGRMDVGDTAQVTTDGLTMTFEIEQEGRAGGVYPGFFPEGADGAAGDQPKGVEMASEDRAAVTLSAPLFYSQWVFTDVDRANEGFYVSPDWTEPGEIAVFAGESDFTFSGDSTTVLFNDTDTVAQDSHAIEGRVQVDMLGAVQGIDMLRDTGRGQSGFAVGGGCEATGAAKEVIFGPTWNGEAYEVTYALRVRNNLPSASTLSAAILAAQQQAPADFLTGAPSGITLSNLQLIDDLSDDAFSAINVTSIDSPDGSVPVNAGYDGITDTQLLSGSASLDAESTALVQIDVEYTPDLGAVDWNDCAIGHVYENQSIVSATAANVDVTDESDDGDNPAPGDDNGAGGVDDPTLVTFDCPPAALNIVKTALVGPSADCPDFAGGVPGDGTAVNIDDGGTVTYCITVENPGVSTATNVVISDPQNPDGDVSIGSLAGGAERTISYDLVVDLDSPTKNTATVTGQGPDGALPDASDTALIAVDPLPLPNLEIVKSVFPGPDPSCPAFAGGTPGPGTALQLDDGDVATYCIVVRNTGPGDAYGISVTDPQAPAGWDGAVGDLAAGESATLSYDLTVDLDTPSLNTATATGQSQYGDNYEVDDTALINVEELDSPNLQIVKTVLVGPGATCPSFASGEVGVGALLSIRYGDTVTYCITAQNRGPGDATDVVISDPMAPVGFNGNIGELGAGAEATRSFDLVVSESTPELNTATVSGNGPYGAVDPDSDSAAIDPSYDPDPNLKIVKTVLMGPNASCPDFDGGQPGAGAALVVDVGDTVTYCIAVQNTSGSAATDVVISDPMAPASFDGNIGNLAVGAEASAQFDLVVDASTQPVNTATVTGRGPNGDLPDESDQALIDPQDEEDPVLEIRKTVVDNEAGMCPNFDAAVDGIGETLTVEYGTTVTYCLAIKNVEGSDAFDVEISDPFAPDDFDGYVGDLAVGQEAHRQFRIEVTDTTPEINTAAVGGSGPNGPVADDQDSARIDPVRPADPNLQVVKTALKGPGATCPEFEDGVQGPGTLLSILYGETVTYCLTVKNTGAADAADVVLSDDQAPAGFDGNIGALASGAEATRSYDLVVDTTTNTTNTVVATGTGPNGTLPSDSDVALIRPSSEEDPNLSVVKTALVGPGADCPDHDGGVAGAGPALNVDIGDVVTYCLTVKNIGLGDATNVVLADNNAPATFDGDIGSLAAGAEATRSYDVTVAAGTAEVNTVVATGEGPNGTVPPDTDSAVIEIAPELEPELAVVKTAVYGPSGNCPSFDAGTAGPGAAVPVTIGDIVTYCVSVRNVGDGDAINVTITDAQFPGDGPISVGDLDSGQTFDTSYDVVVVEGDQIVNTATATGEDPDGNPTDPASDTSVVAPTDQPVPSITITNTVVALGDACADSVEGTDEFLLGSVGDTADWCFTVTNTGNTSLTDITFDNGPLGQTDVDVLGDHGSGAASLAPGDSISFVIPGTIPETELVSQAEVEGTPSEEDGTPLAGLGSVNDTNDARVAETDMTIEKRVLADPAGDCADGQESVEVDAGTEVRWCFTVTNTGGVDVKVTAVTDSVLGVEIPIPEADQILVPGESVTVSTTAIVNADLTNQAEVIGVPTDPEGNPYPTDPIEREDESTVEATSADLSIIKSAGRETIQRGSSVTYGLLVTNDGPDAAEGVTFTDELPDGLSYSTIPNVVGWSCAEAADGRSFTCGAESDMPAGDQVAFTYVVTAASNLSSGDLLTNVATVESDTPDLDPTNNTDRETIRVTIPVSFPVELPAPTPTPEPEDEVLEELIHTGSETSVLLTLATALFGAGALFTVAARRRESDEI